MLIASGHIKPDRHLGPEEIAQIARRLTLARKWVHKHAPDMSVKINDELPKEISLALTAQQKLALQSLAKVLGKEIDQAKLYNSFYEISKSRNLPTKDFFRAAYQVLINRQVGPRLAPFIMALGRERVRAILAQI
jgi:lysyl-tRNA synthetase class 1